MTRDEFTEEMRTDRTDDGGERIPSLSARLRGAMKRKLGRKPDDEQFDEALAKVFELAVVRQYSLVSAIMTAAHDAAAVAAERAKLTQEWAEETFASARRVRGATGEIVGVSIPACLYVDSPEIRRRAFVTPTDHKDFTRCPSLYFLQSTVARPEPETAEENDCILFRATLTIEEKRQREESYSRAMTALLAAH